MAVVNNGYDAGNFQNLLSTSLAGNRTTSYAYDTYGRRFRTLAPLSRPDTTTFDALNRVTSVIRWASATVRTVTSYAYEDSLHLTKVTDPKAQVYSYLYNAAGWVIRELDPAAKADTFAYAANGDLMRHTNRRGQTITYGYDLVHRPTSRAGTSSVTWAYLNNGLKVVAASPQARDTISLNLRGQPTYVKTTLLTPNQTFDRRYFYTAYGLLDSMHVTGGGIGDFQGRKYLYDATKGLLTTIRLGGASTVFNRDANFADTSRTFPGGGDAKTTLGSLHAPLKLTTSVAGYNSNVERWIGLDSLGRIDKHLGWQGNSGRFFQYDSLGRLKVAAFKGDTGNAAPPGPGCPEPGYGLIGSCFVPTDWATLGVVPDTFAYDSVGNRRDKGGTYGTGNRVLTFNGCNYVTDFDGNVTSRVCGGTTSTFTWNTEGQLTNVAITGKPTFGFHYDASGRMVRRDSAGVANRYFLWDGDNLFAELGAAGTTKIAEYSYYPGLDNLHALIIGATAYYAHRDGLGNVVQLSSGTTSQRTYFYTEWGIQQGGTDNLPFGGRDRARWKGALLMGQDSTLYYMRNRWYEAGTGRFLSEDPLGVQGGLNPSVFAGDNPVNGEDPMGLTPCEPVYGGEGTETLTGNSMKEISVAGNFLGWFCPLENDPSRGSIYRRNLGDLSMVENLFTNSYLGSVAGGHFNPVSIGIPFIPGVGPSRSIAVRNLFLRENLKNLPKWMRGFINRGKVPPGFNVDHIKPLSIGGEDAISNMRLLDAATHRLWHTLYHPWRL